MQFGIPRVAFDGSLDGLARDGVTLVLAVPGSRRGTDFAVLSTPDLRLQRLVTLPGIWSFDALSPDGRKLYLVEHPATIDTRAFVVHAHHNPRG